MLMLFCFFVEVEICLVVLVVLIGWLKMFYVMEVIVEYIDDMEDVYLLCDILICVCVGMEGIILLSVLLVEYGLEN